MQTACLCKFLCKYSLKTAKYYIERYTSRCSMKSQYLLFLALRVFCCTALMSMSMDMPSSGRVGCRSLPAQMRKDSTDIWSPHLGMLSLQNSLQQRHDEEAKEVSMLARKMKPSESCIPSAYMKSQPHVWRPLRLHWNGQCRTVVVKLARENHCRSLRMWGGA